MSIAGEVVGRAHELAVIWRFLESRPPVAAAIALVGKPGIGKTTLLRKAVEAAGQLGFLVLSCRLAETEALFPFAGLGDLFAPIVDGVRPRLPDPQRAALDVALLRSSQGDRSIEPRTVAAATLSALKVLGSDRPLLVAIDDAQWLDQPTVSALSFAVRRLEQVPIRFLTAIRTEDDASTELQIGLDGWRSQVDRIEVGPLSTTDLGSMLAHEGVPLPRPQLERVARESGGNPMFALELARRGPDEDAHLPPSLKDAVNDRLEDLDPAVSAAVAMAAAMHDPSRELMLSAGIDHGAIAGAIDADVLTLDGDRVSFSHPLLASVAYDRLGSAERRDTHLRLAWVATNAIERGHHLSRSVDEPDEEIAGQLEAAADEAVRVGDHAGAAAFLVRAADLSADPERTRASTRRLRAAEELELAGDVGAAAALAASLVDKLPPGVLRARARHRLVLCSIGGDLSYEDGFTELARVLDEASDHDATAAEIHLSMGEMASGMCRLEDSLIHLRAAIDLAERAGADQLRVAALSETGFTECMLGHGVSGSARRAFDEWDGTIVSASGYSPRMALACELIHTTDFVEAQRLFLEEIAMAEERGLEAIEVIARAHLAEAQIRSGDWAAALVNGALAAEHARQAANAQTAVGVTYALALAQASVGEHDVARSISTESLAAAETAEDFWFAVSHRAVLGFVALTDDDAAAAIEILEPAWRLMQERGLGDLSIFPVAHVLFEALVAVGRSDEAEAVSASLLACPVGGLPWSQAMAGRCAALAASARGDHDAASAAIERSLAAHAHLPEPFEHARTLYVQGRIERRAHRWANARSAFTQALELFDQLGATRWAEKAASELARIPGRTASTDELTPTERQVAELVAQGLTNKEVAAKLFVSVRAVESNLTKTYAKLGVRSRTELAGRIGNP